MSRTNAIIQEIAEVRGRRRYTNAIAELPGRLRSLEICLNHFDKNNPELIRYFPVALIASLEGYFRLAIKEIVDSDDSFLENIEKSATPMKIDFAVLKAIHGKQITIGEFFAHLLPFSRLEHIESAFTGLLGKSFLSELRTITDRWAIEIRGEPVKPILENPDKVFADVASTFELRHIICHELASAYKIEIPEVEEYFESCVTFLKATEEYITEILYPGAPLTQAAMNQMAGDDFVETQSRLKELIKSLRGKTEPQRMDAFDDAQEKWLAYGKAWANYVADEYAGGTIRPVIYYGALRKITELRISDLNVFWKRLGI